VLLLRARSIAPADNPPPTSPSPACFASLFSVCLTTPIVQENPSRTRDRCRGKTGSVGQSRPLGLVAGAGPGRDLGGLQHSCPARMTLLCGAWRAGERPLPSLLHTASGIPAGSADSTLCQTATPSAPNVPWE
jgi:hypothetical protein